MQDEVIGRSDSPAHQKTVAQPQRAMSRRRMLATSAGAFVGASMIGAGKAASTTQTDVGDKTPHVNFSLAGKTALVTGAARGIGQAICVALAAAGSDVMGLDICAVAAPNLVYAPATPEDLDKTGKLVEAQKRRWIGVKADIRDMPAMKAAVDRAVKDSASSISRWQTPPSRSTDRWPRCRTIIGRMSST
jgi:short chain dehydrogenase